MSTPRSLLIAAARWVFGFIALIVPIIISAIWPEQHRMLGVTDMSRAVAWIVSLLGIAGLFVQAGLEIKGRALGVLVDEKNRYSLSRLQMTLWSVLILASLYVVFVVNLIRTGAGTGEPVNVSLNWNLIILMGISAASFAGAPLALNLKTSGAPNTAVAEDVARQLAAQQSLSQTPTIRGQVLAKQDPQDARIADLIRGEDIGNATLVDLSRTQMLIMTIAIVLAYGIALWEYIASGARTLSALPPIHPTLLGLIFVSHASYIGGKLTAAATGTAGASTSETLARSLQVSQQATDLVRNLQASVATLQSGASKACEGTLMLAQGAAAQAASLPVRAAAADFDVAELATLEGRVAALAATARLLTTGLPSTEIVNAPAPQKVLEVQKKLRGRGHQEVTASGIPDAATEQAIRTELSALGVVRNQLHPHPYKYYEELAGLF